jgi:hypothetical protein
MSRFILHTILTALATGLLNLTAVAAPVALADVENAARHFASHKLGLRTVDKVRALAWETAEPVFFLTSFSEGGWVLGAGDDLLVPVVGWSDHDLPQGELPPALVDWLKAEEQVVVEQRARGERFTETRVAWDNLLGGADSDQPLTVVPNDVPPMLDALWGQGSPYNSQCPADPAGSGGHVYVGCVAVAMAQVMDFWNWPNQGTGSVSYVHSVYGPISVNFAQQTYDWNAMPAGYSDEVAKLLYHAGAAVRMNYGATSSSAQTSMVVTALRQYFGYQETTRMVYRSAYTEQAWLDMISSELHAGRPVVYRGQGAAGGHAFDVDGVMDSCWFHINWGWTGGHNGNFLLGNLNPGSYTFNIAQAAVIGIAPVGVSVNHPPVVAPLFVQGNENQTFSAVLQGNDPDGDALSYEASAGSVTGNVWSWTPPQNANGSYTFTYRACDGGGCSQAAVISVQVASVNQLPVVENLSAGCLGGETVSLSFAGTDADGDALSYTVNGLPIFGNEWSWTPPTIGVHTLSYAACDPQGCGDAATITVTVVASNNAPLLADMTVETPEDEPVAVQLAGHDPDGDTLTYTVDGQVLEGNVFTWTPAADFVGEVDFVVTVSDGVAQSAPATLALKVMGVNDMPQIRPVFTHLAQPGMQRVQLIAWDVDGDALTYLVDGQAIEGSIFEVELDKTELSYIFSYSVTDGHAQTDTATIELTFASKDGAKPEPSINPLITGGNASDGQLSLNQDGRPSTTRLLPAFPNPFNPATTLNFDLATAGMVRLSVYNIAGQRVATLHEGNLAAGHHEMRWDAGSLASGAYLAALESPAGMSTQILQLVK